MSNKISMFVEDKWVFVIMEFIVIYEDGYYKFGLFWRDKNVSLLNNFFFVYLRL